MMFFRRGAFHFCLTLFLCFASSCTDDPDPKKVIPVTGYLNHGDSASYVGMEVCRSCHMDIYKTYVQTGMGQSFDLATHNKSAADFNSSSLCDEYSDLCYSAFWSGEEFRMKEYRIESGDTTHQRIQKIDYIIGSGQHTNSHIYNTGGYLHQAPMTFYTQDKRWDLPPGYEGGKNTRFDRKVGLECLSCHNSYPSMVLGSENKYTNIPNGINCERCHGPGSIHVSRKQKGEKIDTSKFIDYSIVNPGKLNIQQQFDLCQRCHLQGNAVLKDGKSFYDFKPGMVLSDFWTVFLPKYENAEEEFIMASHADRLKMSACFLETSGKISNSSNPQTLKPLKPYKQALTCVTCHNPHVSVKQTGKEIFNNACNKCHSTETTFCSEKSAVRKQKSDNCISCHMPRSGSIDIPHVTVTDHFIRKPSREFGGKNKKESVKKFIGLYAINESNPSLIVRAKAYLYQYEKFEKAPYYLDSAKYILESGVNKHDEFETWIHYYFILQDYPAIVTLASALEKEILLKTRLNTKSWDNKHAWTAYRIGEAFYNTGDMIWAERFLEKAVDLAAFNPEFMNKLGVVQISLKKYAEATSNFNFLTSGTPLYAPGWCNAGYLELLLGNDSKAEKYYMEAIKLDPDYEQAWLNMAGLYLYRKDQKKFNETFRILQKKFPGSQKVANLKSQMGKL